MKTIKTVVLLSMHLMLVSCASAPQSQTVFVTQEVTREVVREVEKQIEVTRIVKENVEVIIEVTRVVEKLATPEGFQQLGPWTVQQTIEQNGQYLVPEEMQPGQWAYVSNDTGGTCWVETFKDLSGTNESKIGNFYADNKGFFVLTDKVRMVSIIFGPCTYTRVGD